MVGLTLALALSQGGLRVALADPMTPAQRVDERFDGRVSALAFASVRMLRALGVWEALARVIPKTLFAPPSAVLGRLAAMTADGSLATALLGSVQHMLVGYLLAVLLAIPVGIIVGRSTAIATAV